MVNRSTRFQDLTKGQQAIVNNWTVDTIPDHPEHRRLRATFRYQKTAQWYADVVNANTSGWTASVRETPTGRFYVRITHTPPPPLSTEAEEQLREALWMPTIM
jgi:regulation of enolase protein 1 (concanavalin A-like superfamily)